MQEKIILLEGIEDIDTYEITLPPRPKESEMVNFGLPASQQVFKRTQIPKKLIQLDEQTKIVGKEGIKRILDATAQLEADDELSAFVESLWKKRINGEWQLINGKPIYLTGDHFFYLNFYYLYGYYPQFRWTDAEEFYWWKFCVEENENAYGGTLFTRRQVGKSLRSCSILLNYVTSHSFAKVGMQSKTEDDAGSLFKKAIIPQFKRLPFFFKPLYDSAGGMKSRIDFMHPERDSLESWIDYRASTDTAYDGETMDRLLVDESGKMKKPASPIEILDKIKPALMQDGRIRGKTLFITTVEEMDKGGGKEYKVIWDSSDIKKLNELGQTESGLVRYFTPAYRNIFFDKYGFPIIDNPTVDQMRWRKEQKHQFFHMGGKEYINKHIEGAKKQAAKQDRIRKYPRTIREAFQSTTSFCHFDLEILNDRLKKFTFGYPPEMMDKMTFGNFHWKDSVYGGDVEFKATSQEDARWWISYMPDENNRNKFNIHPVNQKKSPANWHKFCSGADPFKFDTDEVIHKNKMSDAAMIVYAEQDIMVDTPDKNPADYVTGDMCAEYMYRADTVDEMCEDFAKACIFYGMKVFPERNNSDVVRYFKLNGFENYVQFDMQVKKSNEGTFFSETAAGSNTDVKTIQSMFKVVQKYVKENGLRCKFYRTLEQLKDVSPDNMNPYDLFVALAVCLRVVIEFNPIRLSTQEQEQDDVGDIIGSLSPRSFGEETQPNNSYGYA